MIHALAEAERNINIVAEKRFKQMNEIIPNQSGLLQVSKLHKINYATFGNPNGIPMINFHGGPGGCFKSKYITMYDLEKFFLIVFDQRGCGKSEPFGEIKENSPDNAIEDAIALLNYLKIDKCVVSGLSYGATLSLLFAEKYPEKVLGLFIGMIFIPINYNEEWFYKSSVQKIFPKSYDEFISIIKEENATKIFYRFENANQLEKKEIAAAFDNFEMILMKGLNSNNIILAENILDFDLNSKRIYLYYASQDFFGTGEQIMKNTEKLKGFPIRIIHGELDFCCPISMAWNLKKKLPQADFTSVPYEGHGGTMQMELFFRSLKTTEF